MGLAPYGDPERYLAAMRELVKLDGDALRARARLLRAPQGGRRHDLGRAARRRSAASSPTGMEEAFGPAREPRSRADARSTRTSPPRCRRCSRRRTSTSSRPRTERTGSTNLCLAGGVALNAVANGRIRPETPFEERLRPARGRRLRHRRRRRVLRLEPGARQAARLRDGARVHGPAVQRRGRARRRSAPAGFDARAPRRRRALPARRRADRRRRRRRLVPGADGVRAARARQPLDRRRPAAARHEGHPQRADQAPRAVPPVRAVDPRRGDRRVVRAGLHVAVHGAWSTRRATDKRDEIPAVNHVDDTGRLQTVERAREPALLPADQGVRATAPACRSSSTRRSTRTSRS